MKIFLIFLLLPLKLFSQDIEGVWTGAIYNDTTRKYIPYEIVITENKGKFKGYSHTIFTGENNRQETGIKTLKIKRKNDKILIEDDELIYNNYSEPPPKGVRQYSVLNIIPGDSGKLMIGVFNTNQTKEYASLTGTIRLEKQNKIQETKIIPRLEELHLASSLSFIKNKPGENVLAAKDPQPGSEIKKTLFKPDSIIIKKENIESRSTIAKKEILPVEKQNPVLVKNAEPVLITKKEIEPPPAITKNQTALLSKKELPLKNIKEEKSVEVILNSKEKTPATIIKTKRNDAVAEQNINKKITESIQSNRQPVVISRDKPKDIAISPTHIIVQNTNTVSQVISQEKLSMRKIETIKTVNFKSDSLVLTLYDNGVVDGDTVSVILNGKIIMPRQGLSTKAITKTIYITPDLGDSLQMIMYAENLGSIPPNTGLLIIQDGEDKYEIRFAGDLEKNAAIILRRKSN